MDKLNSSELEELRRDFAPAIELVDTLPNPKEVKDFAKIFKKNPDGTYNKYQMVDGDWILTGQNLTKG